MLETLYANLSGWGRVGGFNRYFESGQCEEILNFIRRHCRIKTNEISNIIIDNLKNIIIKGWNLNQNLRMVKMTIETKKRN